MRRLNVLYKIFLGDWDRRTKFFPLYIQRNIKDLKYGLNDLLSRIYFRLKKPAVIFIPVGFFLMKLFTVNGEFRE